MVSHIPFHISSTEIKNKCYDQFKLVKNIPAAHTEAIWSIAWISENQVATGGNDDTLKKWFIQFKYSKKIKYSN